jgi:acetolactate synthase-1/3 small subunit
MSTPDIAPAVPATANGAAAARESLRIISVVVENNPGVLFRVSGMIRRRGFNIMGLSVGPTDQAGLSRMTLTVDAAHAEVDQVEKQLDRLIEVIEIEDITEQPKRIRELVLVKLAATGERRREAVEEATRIGGRVIDDGDEHLIVEIAAEYQRDQEVVRRLEPYGIIELTRSGPVAMSR